MLKTFETDLQLWIFGKKLQGDRNGICSNTIHIEQVTNFAQIYCFLAIFLTKSMLTAQKDEVSQQGFLQHM